MNSELLTTDELSARIKYDVRTIREVLRRVMASPVDKEILVVDDGSTDGTRASLELIEKMPLPPGNRLRIFLQDQNQGKGAAIGRAVPEARGLIRSRYSAPRQHVGAGLHNVGLRQRGKTQEHTDRCEEEALRWRRGDSQCALDCHGYRHV